MKAIRDPATETTKITAAAKRALIAADPEYFSWSVQQQEHFRATLDEASENRIRHVLLESLLNIQCERDQVSRIWREISLDKLLPLNWALLLTTGIGDDYIYLNEIMADDTSLLDYETLYEYDYAQYLFQEEAKHRDFPDYKGSRHLSWSYSSWIRLLINDQFHYGTLISLADFVIYEVESAGDDYISELIPHDYVEGPNNDKEVEGGFVWDMRVDASGLEGELDELRRCWWNYQNKRCAELDELYSAVAPAVYIRNDNWDRDPHTHFIFNNLAILKQIRWRHFLTDCTKFTADLQAINDMVEQEKARATDWLTAKHKEIMETFDPKVVKLQKKRRIVIAPGALEGLNKILDDEQ